MHKVVIKINGHYRILPKFQAIAALCTDSDAMTLASSTTKSFLERISLGSDNVLQLRCVSDLTMEISEYHGTPRMFTVVPSLLTSEIEELKNSMAIIEHSQWGGIYQVIDVKKTNDAVGLLVQHLSVNLDAII